MKTVEEILEYVEKKVEVIQADINLDDLPSFEKYSIGFKRGCAETLYYLIKFIKED